MESGSKKRYIKIIKLSTPVMLSFLSFQLLGVIDILMVGSLGKEAIASVGLALTLFYFFAFPAEGLLDGVTILASKAYGSNDKQKLRNIMKHSILLAIIMGVAGMLFFFPMALLMRFMTNNDIVYKEAMTYLGISFLGIMPQLIIGVILRFMMAVQKTKPVAVISNSIVIVNIIFGWLLIFGKMGFPVMGVAGSAVATIIAKFTGLGIAVIFYLKMKKEYFKDEISENTTKERLEEVFRTGFPVLQTNLLEISAWTFFIGFISRLGTAPMAAHEIGMKIKDIAYLPGSAIGVIAANLAGGFLGSKDYTNIKKYTYTSMKIAIFVMGLFGVVFMVIPEFLIGVFTKDNEVRILGVQVLRVMAIYQIADAVFIVIRNTLNGLNDTKFVRNMVLIGSWGIMVPVAFVFTNIFKVGVVGAWIGLTLYVLVIGVVYLIRFEGNKWYKKI